MAKKAFAPIEHITRTAEEIGRGDLSKRLHLPKVRDEVGRLVIVFDEMLERLEESFNREQQFTSDASHELRTPITVISSQAEAALSETRGVREYREALQVILKESRRMGLLVAQLLNLTRGDRDQYRTEMELIDLRVIAEEVVEEMKKTAVQHGVSITLEGEAGLDVEADQTLITRLFINLIDNGIRYNRPQGWVRVVLSRKGDAAQIEVIDGGIGIGQENLPRIFDRFYRADKARNREGAGLGLSIVRWIIDAHGGDIRVESQPEQGASFTVLLPLRQSKN